MKNQLDSILSQLTNYSTKKYLLAVSGGVDSMVLMHLFHQLELDFSVAHCNFNLRGSESNLDEELVRKIANQYGKECFVKQFDVEVYKSQNGVSTQMAARDLRYSWFESLKIENGFDYVVTAHHLDDNIETFFLNLARGTGIEGVTGMKKVSGFLLRPLLNFEKNELISEAQLNEIEFREDQSNASNNYKRNSIRNQIIPLFKELNPSFGVTMNENIKRLESVNVVYKKAVEKEWSNQVILTVGEEFHLNSKKVLGFTNPSLYLFEFLKRFGFDFDQSQQIISTLRATHSSGKKFNSNSNTLLIDREIMILSPKRTNENSFQTINNSDEIVTYPIRITLKELSVEEFEINSDPNCVFLDSGKLKFPLVIRNWQEGDRFQPLGMKGKKKVSDFLIDEKVSLNKKENTLVLISEDEICWVIGYRISDKFKVSDSTQTVLRITKDGTEHGKYCSQKN